MKMPLAFDDAHDRQVLLLGLGGPFDAPIVRHVELPPGRIVQFGILAVGDLAQMEPPIAVEVDRGAVGGSRGGGG